MVNYPKDWRLVEIEDIFTVTRGQVLSTEKIKDAKSSTYRYPVYSSQTLNNGLLGYYNDYLFKDAITWTTDGANAGDTNYRKGDFYCTNVCGVLLNNEGYANECIAAIINSISRKYVSYVGNPKLMNNVVKKIKICIPELKEQQAIAETLVAFDEHIENLEELIAKKKMIRDGSVEDLMSGKTRLDGFDGEWKTVQFQNVITPKARIGWQGLKKDEYLKKGFAYLISGTDFENGSISLNEISYVNKERYSMDANIQVKEGDVLVTKDGTIGKIARVPELNKKATLNSGVFVFRTNHLLEECFLYWILRSSIFGKFIDDLSAGSTIKHLYQKDLKNFSFTMPVEIKEQKAIASILTAMDEEIEDLRQEKDKIERIKAGAMDDLLTGKIRLVKEA